VRKETNQVLIITLKHALVSSDFYYKS